MTLQERRQHQLETARRRAGSGSPAHTAPSTAKDADAESAARDQSAEDAAQGRNKVSSSFPGLPGVSPEASAAVEASEQARPQREAEAAEDAERAQLQDSIQAEARRKLTIQNSELLNP